MTLNWVGRREPNKDGRQSTKISAPCSKRSVGETMDEVITFLCIFFLLGLSCGILIGTYIGLDFYQTRGEICHSFGYEEYKAIAGTDYCITINKTTGTIYRQEMCWVDGKMYMCDGELLKENG